MQMPYTENPYNNYTPQMTDTSYAPDRPSGFLGRVFGRARLRGGQQAVPQFDPNNLPEHAHPHEMDGARDSEATAVGITHEQDLRNKYETGYGNTSPTAHSPMVTGHTGDAEAGYAAYTHGAGDSYTHAGDHYGHSGDDYLRDNRQAHLANTTATLPYPADNPYDSPYEPHRTEHMPSYPPQGHHYGDGIYDRP